VAYPRERGVKTFYVTMRSGVKQNSWFVHVPYNAIQASTKGEHTYYTTPLRVSRPISKIQSDSITAESLQALCTERTGDVFWRLLFKQVAYLQDERQLSRLVSPGEFGFVRPEQRLPFIL